MVLANTIGWTTPRACGAAALGLLLLCSTGAGAAAPASTPTTHTVTIEGTHFQPDALTVSVGDVIVWVNKDPFPHTATATAKTGGFDSQPIAPGNAWRYTAAKSGHLDYICTLHPTMKATLHVR